MKTIVGATLFLALMTACSTQTSRSPQNIPGKIPAVSSGAGALRNPDGAPVAPSRQAPSGPSCTANLTVQLETFGEGVTIELRQGTPGSSTVVESQRSSGGRVYFGNLCTGSYFMAIGNEDAVSVTPVRQFVDGRPYRSTIRVTQGGGNITRRSRGGL